MSALDSCVAFLQRLIRTESLPGREDAVARLVADEMRTLGYDEVRTDEAGNVIGLVRGEGATPPMMFNTHLDHVDVGDRGRWPYPPFGAEIHEGRVWGRGAVDIKGPLAAQVHGVAGLRTSGSRPPGDVYVTAVVQEEVGGLGAQHLLTHLAPALVIVGEPSRNQVRRGHRGRTEAVLHVTGRSVHASIPKQGCNPLYVIARFVDGLRSIPHGDDADLGPSSVAPTLIRTDQTSANVVPGEAWLTCDWRNVPSESADDVRRILQRLAEASLADDAAAEVTVPEFDYRSYTGFTKRCPSYFPSFVLPSDHPAVQAACRVLRDAIAFEGPAGVWKFATDGGHFARHGQTVVGFGPGDDGLAHTVRESIEIEALGTALEGNAALARAWPRAVGLGT